MIKSLVLATLVAVPVVAFCGAADAPPAAEQETVVPFVAPVDVQGFAASAPDLARRVIAALSPAARERDPNGLYQLEMAAGDSAAAETTLEALRRQYRAVGRPLALLAYNEMWTTAAKEQARSGGRFESAVASAFPRVYGALDDKTAVLAETWSIGSGPAAKQQLEADLATARGKREVPLGQVAALVRDYWQYREFYVEQPLVQRLIAEDEGRRFIISDDVQIKTKQGVTLSAYVVRPRRGPTRQAAALNFTIYAYADPTSNWAFAKYAAARGYVGVLAFARGKWKSTDEIRPFETEGEDAGGVIDWIAKQPWSDGRVAMWGGSYSGFAAWAAAKHRPPALKTIAAFVSNLPGDGLPMEHNVFLNANYAWGFYATDDRFTDDDLYNDSRRWNELPGKWFASGRPYREIDAVDGKANPWLQRHLMHPSFDAYWQAMAPYKDEFAKIDIPILEVSGYPESDSVSAYFMPESERYRSGAEHDLVIGPYDHPGAQHDYKSPVLIGYPIDPVAQIDTPALTFQWFDYVLKGGPKPALLKDRINFEVMGANTWRHAPSIARMSDKVLNLYLTDAQVEGRYRLAQTPPPKPGFVAQTIDFADRKSVNDLYPAAQLSDHVRADGALWFISDPIKQPLSVSGQISGVLRTSINKRDMDFAVAVYEVMPDGRYFDLTYYLGRASYAWDMTRRRLLTPGRIETIPFSRTSMMSRQMSVGSRLLVLLTVNKNGGAQVNYGTGKDVSDESIADAKEPLEVRWYNDSVIRVPVSVSPTP